MNAIDESNVFNCVRAALSAAIEAICGARDERPPLTLFAKSDDFDYQSAFAQKLYATKAKSDGDWKVRFPSLEALVQSVGERLCAENPKLLKSFKVSENGFLLLLLSDELLVERIGDWLRDGVKAGAAAQPQTVVVDFSSPNIAKEMHVGHLRSTIIGESVCRLLEALGHRVARVNHVGDWGTQFGMLIAHLFEVFPDFVVVSPRLADLETFYRESKQKFDSDAEFKQRAHQYVVRLQAGDERCLEAWRALCKVSREFYEQVYTRLDIRVEEFGESFYNPMIPSVIAELKEKELVRVDQGALCMFLPGRAQPLIVVKSDGGFNYDTTDLAAARYRLCTLRADRVIYITDIGQATHFAGIFEAARLAGWAAGARLEHMGFGVVLNEQGERMKTRAGKSVKLMELLDEARDRARAELEARAGGAEGELGRRTHVLQGEFENAAEVLGMAAIKYFDLRQNRVQNYQFNLDAMLNQKGDTAVYLMYSYIRLCSILRKSEANLESVRATPFAFTHERERVLARRLVKLCEVVESAAEQLALNKLCEFLYGLATRVAEGYALYAILGNEHSAQRLKLMLVARDAMKLCFELLGIATIDRI